MCGEGECPGTTHKGPRGGGRDGGLHTNRSLREGQAALSCARRPCAISPVAQKEDRHVRPRDCHTHHAQRSVSLTHSLTHSLSVLHVSRATRHGQAHKPCTCACAATAVFCCGSSVRLRSGGILLSLGLPSSRHTDDILSSEGVKTGASESQG